ncbi:MAG: caspase family protein [Elusimicrobia bacterium]|nr:caspase family protein [Elusimicrobiota bacterium]MDE2236278.1 caspase family protein [Elusimicrobiota bacterium]MDE2426556.1 caspase family protein [Elusimicrobiota bacterium]
MARLLLSLSLLAAFRSAGAEQVAMAPRLINARSCRDSMGRMAPGKVIAIILAGPGDVNDINFRAGDERYFRNDANWLENWLHGLGIHLVVKILYDRSKPLASDRSLQAIMRDLPASINPCDTTIFAFTGHGSGGSLTTATQWKRGRQEEVTEEVKPFVDWLRALPGQRLFFFDSCGSGDFSDQIWHGYIHWGRRPPYRNPQGIVLLSGSIAGESTFFSPIDPFGLHLSFTRRFFTRLKEARCSIGEAYSSMGGGSIYPPNTAMTIPCWVRAPAFP